VLAAIIVCSVVGLLLQPSEPVTAQETEAAPTDNSAEQDLRRHLVLIHGLGASAAVWDQVTPILQGAFRVWLFELPGHGRTQPVSQPTIETVAELLRGFMVENQIEYPTVVGHAMGGLIAMRYTFDHPDQVDRLVVIDAAPKQLASQEQKLAVANELVNDYDRFVASQYLDQSSRPELSESILDQALRTDSATFISLLMSSFDFDLTEELPRQAVPILVVGSHALFPDPDHARERLDQIGFGKARTVSFKHMSGVGHYVMLERPIHLASVILAFAASEQPR
jgi:pimeloyl-ACP methyl ester carboxylesterase